MSLEFNCEHKALLKVKLDGSDGAILVYKTMSGEVREYNTSYKYDVVVASVICWIGSSLNIQQAFPYMTVDERELMVTGIGPQEWDDLFEMLDNDSIGG